MAISWRLYHIFRRLEAAIDGVSPRIAHAMRFEDCVGLLAQASQRQTKVISQGA